MSRATSSDHHHAAGPPWRNVRVLRVVAQVAVLLVVALGILYLGGNLTSEGRL